MDLNLSRPIGFSSMVKPISALCNLNCQYCYYLEKLQLFDKSTSFKMSDEVLEVYIKQYIESQQLPEVTFVWHGGEPSLTGIGFYERALKYQKKYAGAKKIWNSFQTNGTLLNEDWIRFFRDNNFFVGISIDGPEEIHNNFRFYANGKPTFSDVMKSIELLHRYQVEFNTMTVVHRKSAQYALPIYNFLKQIGSGFMQFLPIVERESNKRLSELKLAHNKTKEAELTEWSVLPEQYGDFLIEIFNQWVRTDVGRVFVQMFDVTLANWVGEHPHLCEFSRTCGNSVIVEYNGDVYSCDHFVFPDYYLGNILDKPLYAIVGSKRQFYFGNEKLSGLTRQCHECEFKFACNGGCLKNRFAVTQNNEPGLNYLCPAYKKFFSYVAPYMEFMKLQLQEKKSPFNIMEWAKSRTMAF